MILKYIFLESMIITILSIDWERLLQFYLLIEKDYYNFIFWFRMLMEIYPLEENNIEIYFLEENCFEIYLLVEHKY